MGICVGKDFKSGFLQKDAFEISQAIKCWLSGQRVQPIGEQDFSVINESTTSDSWCWYCRMKSGARLFLNACALFGTAQRKNYLELYVQLYDFFSQNQVHCHFFVMKLCGL